MDQMTIYIILAGVFGLFMAWGIGANDVANAMATSVGSRALTVKKAIIIAAIFEFAGAYLAGGHVTKTIRKGIIESDVFCVGCQASPDILVYGMLAALLAAATWLLIASRNGWPVSTTHTIVGAVVGFAAVGVGPDAVQWGKVGTIVMSWVVSPLFAGILAYMIFSSVQKLILNTEHPFENAKRYGPLYLFAVGFLIAMVTIKKGLKHVGLDIGDGQAFLMALGLGAGIAIIGGLMIRRIKMDPRADRKFHYTNVEKVFGLMMIFTASAMAFAHGSNDVANAVGPVAAVVSVATTGTVLQQSVLPSWVLLLGGIGIVAGLATFGYRVMRTVGHKITELTPSRGFAAEIAAAGTVVMASYTGMPISTTHTLVGAVLGVGFARGIAALNLRVVGSIFMSWVVTLPAGAGLSIMFFYMFKGIFLT
ncbi:MAG TPA: inorganic phosphate transporter [Acidiferrobacteraceae bacterium]|nr:inorganic phosphate transporter [Acidiferrobacteraceae bacterium]